VPGGLAMIDALIPSLTVGRNRQGCTAPSQAVCTPDLPGTGRWPGGWSGNAPRIRGQFAPRATEFPREGRPGGAVAEDGAGRGWWCSPAPARGCRAGPRTMRFAAVRRATSAGSATRRLTRRPAADPAGRCSPGPSVEVCGEGEEKRAEPGSTDGLPGRSSGLGAPVSLPVVDSPFSIGRRNVAEAPCLAAYGEGCCRPGRRWC